MNPKNLEGKTLKEQKSMLEVDLIADFEMEYGQPDNWSDEVTADFNRKWEEICKKFRAARCKATIVFGDDHGDNHTTFHCELIDEHTGQHKEEGDMGYGVRSVPYILQWDGDMTREDDEEADEE